MIKKKSSDEKIHIDLTGPDGSAYFLLGVAKRLSIQLGKDWDNINRRMKSGNYNNLVIVLEEEFGDHIILYK
uniref:Uncharacterized protein n=1 Tax=viral metagenome TaxID=1070528 RepID=A0A6M3IUP9_9ZZZZ